MAGQPGVTRPAQDACRIRVGIACCDGLFPAIKPHEHTSCPCPPLGVDFGTEIRGLAVLPSSAADGLQPLQ